jgi:hypothetical protein
MNERIREFAEHAFIITIDGKIGHVNNYMVEKFAELVVNDCIDKIETYRIPVGNSPAGEMACEWTYEALKEIRDEIKEHFGIKE